MQKITYYKNRTFKQHYRNIISTKFKQLYFLTLGFKCKYYNSSKMFNTFKT